jgi:hypothetical protein
MSNAPNAPEQDLHSLNSAEDAHNPLLLTAQVLEFLIPSESECEPEPKTEN